MAEEDTLTDDSCSPINEGWADTMQKILNTKKPKKKKTVILAKAKKLSAMKSTKVESEDKVDGEGTSSKFRKTDWMSKGHKKPNPLERNRERQLQKLTVRGVIQLFNAVNQHRKSIMISSSSTLPSQENNFKSIDKNSFIDILTKGTKSVKTSDSVKKIEKASLEQEKIEDDSNTWNVLRTDFMSGGKWKNWDKTSEMETTNLE